MKNNKGISLVVLVITIIVMIILTWIVWSNSSNVLDNSQKAVFQGDFRDAVSSISMYNTEANLRANNPDYDENLLSWDGKSERAES